MADTLSRVPGSELLSQLELCSDQFTLGVLHFADVPVKLQNCQLNSVQQRAEYGFLNGVISIDERESFREQLLAEQ